MSHSKPKHLKTDYGKYYQTLLGRSSLGERTPDFTSNMIYYADHLLRWHTNKIFPYSFTISPKSSPLIRLKKPLEQYQFMVNFLRQTLSKYSNKYFVTFEMYADNENIHCHGFTQFRTIDNIRLFRKEVKQFYNLTTDKNKKVSPLTHVKSIGYDEDAQKRWIGYLSKEMEYMIKESFTPVYRWDDDSVEPIRSKTKSKKTNNIFIPMSIIRPVAKESDSVVSDPVAHRTPIPLDFEEDYFLVQF